MLKRTLPLLLAATAPLFGCGGSPATPNAELASLATAPPPSAAPDGSAGSDDEQAALAYVECMRDQGVDVPDPVVADDGTIGFDPADLDVDPSSAEFDAANADCESLLVGVDFSIGNEEMTAFRDAFQRFTDCLREEGLDVGDFQFGDGNARRAVTGSGDLIELVAPAIDGLDPTNPLHQAGVDTCQPTLSEAFDELVAGGA